MLRSSELLVMYVALVTILAGSVALVMAGVLG